MISVTKSDIKSILNNPLLLTSGNNLSCNQPITSLRNVLDRIEKKNILKSCPVFLSKVNVVNTAEVGSKNLSDYQRSFNNLWQGLMNQIVIRILRSVKYLNIFLPSYPAIYTKACKKNLLDYSVKNALLVHRNPKGS